MDSFQGSEKEDNFAICTQRLEQYFYANVVGGMVKQKAVFLTLPGGEKKTPKSSFTA